MIVVSAIQFCPRLAKCRADVADNFRRCKPLIDLAGRFDSQLIVFPELFLTGYSFLSTEEASEVAEPSDGPTYQLMASVATELRSYLAWGYVEFWNGKLFNSASVVDPAGRLVIEYKKLNLWGNDFLWATSGASYSDELPPIVKTELGNLSLVICRDIRDKYPINTPRIAAQEPPLFANRKVDIVAAPCNWGKGGFPSNSWMDMAADNNCTLVIANRWGSETNNSVHGEFEQDFHQGGSAIIESNWKVHINGLRFKQDCVVTACLENK